MRANHSCPHPSPPPSRPSDVLAQLASSSNTTSLPNPLHRGHHQIKFLDFMTYLGKRCRLHPVLTLPTSATAGLVPHHHDDMPQEQSHQPYSGEERTKSIHKTLRDTVVSTHFAGLGPDMAIGNDFFSTHHVCVCVHRTTASTCRHLGTGERARSTKTMWPYFLAVS